MAVVVGRIGGDGSGSFPRIIFLVATALLLVLPPIQATGGTLPGGSWMLFEAPIADGLNASIVIDAARSGGGMIAIFVYDMAGKPAGGIMGFKGAGGLDARISHGETAVVRPPPNGQSSLLGQITAQIQGISGFRVLLVSTGSIEWSTYAVDAGAGHPVQLLAMGNRTWYVKHTDESDLTLRANLGWGAAVERSGRYTYDVDGVFVGAVLRSAEFGEEQLSWHTPSGVRECSCISDELFRPGAEGPRGELPRSGPGTYLIARESTRVQDIEVPILSGADVILPG